MLNQQGDTIALLDENGAVVVTYEYDAWGKEISYTAPGTLGSKLYQYNALKYRGYYFDAESGFYYVSSRYYDPEIGRFISADTIDILGSSSDLYDMNLYAYCDNNPIVRVDSGGATWKLSLASGSVLASGGMVKIGAAAVLKSIGGTIMAGVSAVTPIGWLAIGTVVVVGGIVYIKGKKRKRPKKLGKRVRMMLQAGQKKNPTIRKKLPIKMQQMY